MKRIQNNSANLKCIPNIERKVMLSKGIVFDVEEYISTKQILVLNYLDNTKLNFVTFWFSYIAWNFLSV